MNVQVLHYLFPHQNIKHTQRRHFGLMSQRTALHLCALEHPTHQNIVHFMRHTTL